MWKKGYSAWLIFPTQLFVHLNYWIKNNKDLLCSYFWIGWRLRQISKTASLNWITIDYVDLISFPSRDVHFSLNSMPPPYWSSLLATTSYTFQKKSMFIGLIILESNCNSIAKVIRYLTSCYETHTEDKENGHTFVIEILVIVVSLEPNVTTFII